MSMEQEPKPGSASEAMSFGLMEYADRMGSMMASTKDSLTEQVSNLQELQRWTVESVQGVQQRADAAIQRLDAERQKLEVARMKLEGIQALLQTNTVQAIHDAVRRQSGDIKNQTQSALVEPLHNIQQAAGQVRQNVKDSKWLFVASVLLAGILIGVFAGYFFVVRAQNAMDDRLDRIEQWLAAQQQPVPTPTAVVPAHKAKAK